MTKMKLSVESDQALGCDFVNSYNKNFRIMNSCMFNPDIFGIGPNFTILNVYKKNAIIRNDRFKNLDDIEASGDYNDINIANLQEGINKNLIEIISFKDAGMILRVDASLLIHNVVQDTATKYGNIDTVSSLTLKQAFQTFGSIEDGLDALKNSSPDDDVEYNSSSEDEEDKILEALDSLCDKYIVCNNLVFVRELDIIDPYIADKVRKKYHMNIDGDTLNLNCATISLSDNSVGYLEDISVPFEREILFDPLWMCTYSDEIQAKIDELGLFQDTEFVIIISSDI